MSAGSVQQMADRVAELLEDRLRIKGNGLAAKLRRGGRVLPPKVRAAATILATAAEQAQNARLMMQIDHGKVAEAYHLCVTHLGQMGAGDRRMAMVTGALTRLAIIGVTVFVLIVAVLVWRGYL